MSLLNHKEAQKPQEAQEYLLQRMAGLTYDSFLSYGALFLSPFYFVPLVFFCASWLIFWWLVF